MMHAGIIILWKAPQRGRDAAREVVEGFDPQEYPGNGPYFATVQEVAEQYQLHYRSGLQAFYLSTADFEELRRKGMIVADPFFPEGISYHVPADGLSEFNMALKSGPANEFAPET
jgi:hypothetical protein